MNDRIILILLGKRGAGKTSLAKLFENRDGFKHIEVSQSLRLLREKLGFNEMALRYFVEKCMKERGNTYLVKHLCSDYIFTHRTNTVITGLRHPSEIDFLRNELGGCKICLVYLQSSFTNRFFRILRRKERRSIWQFIVEEYYSIKWGDKYLQKNSLRYKNHEKIERAFCDLQTIITNNKYEYEKTT